MLYRLNEKDQVINEARSEVIQRQYQPVIDSIASQCATRLTDNIRSIYVRGSVSVGRASPGISDLDFVVVVFQEISANDRVFLSAKARELEIEFPFVTFIDITTVTVEQLLSSKEFANLAVYLKTQSFLIFGKDILLLLPEIHVGPMLAMRMYGNLEHELTEMRLVIENPESNRTYLGEKKPVEFWCVWTMRVLLRSGLGLVMMKRPVYSQDLETCYEIFAAENPALAGQMKQALTYAVSPISDRKKLTAFLYEFVPEYIALWNNLIKQYGKIN